MNNVQGVLIHVCVRLIYITGIPFLIQLDVTLPQGVHSHCAVEYCGSVIVMGGLTSTLQAVPSCTKLHCHHDKLWTVEDFVLAQPLPPWYNATYFYAYFIEVCTSCIQ